MKKQAKSTINSKLPAILTAVFFVVATITGGTLYYLQEKSDVKDQSIKHLHAISEMKISQITEWQKERFGDAAVLARSPFIREAVELWMKNPRNLSVEKKIHERLHLFEEYFEYNDIMLISAKAGLLLNISSRPENLTEELKRYILTFDNQRQISLHDFYRDENTWKILLEYIAPIRANDNSILCYLVLQVNPARGFYARIKNWPVESPSSEALLVRLDGDSALVLNDLRLSHNSALNLRFPLQRREGSLLTANPKQTGTVEAFDYRGQKVLADVRRVPDTKWLLITKTDITELYSPLKFKAAVVLVLGLMLLAFTIAVLVSWYNKKQTDVFKVLLQKETEIRLAQEEFKTTLYSIGDAVITTDIRGRIRQMNPVAEAMTGWSETEAQGQNLSEVFHIVNESTRRAVISPVDRVLHEGKVVDLANHTLLISRTGREICIADSGAPIRTANNEIIGVVLVFRDQTEERKAEMALEESESRFRSLFENMVEGVALHELVFDNNQVIDYRIVNINPRFEQILGLNRRDVANKMASVLYGSAKAPYLDEYSKVAQSGVPYQFTTYFPPMDKYFDISVAPWGLNGFATIFTDISERVRTEKLLMNLNQRMSLHYKNTPLAVIEWDSDFRVTSWNGAAERIFGYSAAEAIGKSALELIVPPELVDKTRHVWDSLLQQTGGTLYNMENVTKNGSRVQSEWYNTVLVDNDGNVLGVASLCHDTTEQRESEEQLRQSEEKFRSLYENVDIGLYRTTPDGSILMANNTLIKMLGYESFDELARINLENSGFESPESRRRFKELLAAEGNIIGYEARFFKKDGSIIYLRENSKAIYGPAGNILYYDGSLEDITEEREAQERLLKFLKAVEQSPVGIVITDIRGNIEYVNPKVSEVTGYTPRELLGQNPRLFKSGQMPQNEYKMLWETILAGKEWRGELLNCKKDGTIYWENASISPLKNENGEITHFVAVKEDITERKLMIKELIEAKEKAEEMNRIKSNFFSNMSHELRTPLIGILGYSEVMQDYLNGQEDLLQMAQTIQAGGKRLLDTLNLILNISKIEAAKIEVHRSNVDVCTILSEVHRLNLPLAAQKNIGFYCNFISEEVICLLDEKLFFDAMNNLVNNAIKYTDSGKVWISVAGIDGKARIEIGDTGIGIPKDKQDIIWEAFRQVSEGFGRSFEGSGLGLTITKRYIELMNGLITVESDEGKGTVFHVEFTALKSGLNLRTADSELSTELGKRADSNLKPAKPSILMVEDDPIVISLVSLFLSSKYSLDFSTSAVDALEKTRKFVYDALLMDINLRKGMDGVQLTHKIRQMPAYKDIPIIAVTAYAMEKDREEFLSHGLTHYLSKPFEKEQLINLLSEVFPNK